METIPFYTTRREFLSNGLRVVSAAAAMPIFLSHTAQALTASRKRRDDSQRVLIVVQLAGGNDGLNTIVPYEDDLYYRHRRRLALPRHQLLKLEDGVGLHPAATGLKELFDDGRLAVIQGVGYPNPNRSHFVSTDIWHTADPSQRQHKGWLGRYVDAASGGADPPEPVQAIALMQAAPLALRGERFSPLAFNSPRDLGWQVGERDRDAATAFGELNNADGDLPETPHQLAGHLQRAARNALLAADDIRAAAGDALGDLRRAGGNHLARQLQMVARMIKAGLPTKVYYVSLGGFDTHTGQLGRHQQLLRQLAEALVQFIRTLKRDRLSERVLIMTFSEFGRRVQENSSGGTDHGAAAPMFLCGDAVRPGIHEDQPSLNHLDRGDLVFGCDFRRVYATVLRDWLAVRPRDVNALLGRGFGPLHLLRSS